MITPGTPLPWSNTKCPCGDEGCNKWHISPGAGGRYCKGDAAYIVQACNAFPDLVEALRKIAYEPIGPSEATDREVLRGIEEIAKAALAKAGGAS